MCSHTRIRILAEKVEREMFQRSERNAPNVPGSSPRRHIDSAALSILSRAPLNEPSRDHISTLTPWRQKDSWSRTSTPRDAGTGKAALPPGFARPPWRGTVFPAKKERPGSKSCFSTAEWKMEDYSRASDMNRTWKMTDRRKIRSGPFRACASEDSLGQIFTRPQSQVRSARPQLMGGSLAVGINLPSMAHRPRPPAARQIQSARH